MRKKNVIGISFLMALTLMLTGCSVFPTLAGMESKEAKAYANVYDLKANKAYVWHHEGEADIRQDLARDREGENIFFACPKGDTNFKGKELDRSGQYPRSIWINSSMDDEIPTIIGNNALIYISKTTVPEEIVFERFADYGYSIGVSNMISDEGGHYYFVYAETDKDDYKYYVDTASEAFSLLCFDTVARLYLDKVGGILVTEENVSDGGTVLGLTKDMCASFIPVLFIRTLCFLRTSTASDPWSSSYLMIMSSYIPTASKLISRSILNPDIILCREWGCSGMYRNRMQKFTTAKPMIRGLTGTIPSSSMTSTAW